MIGHNFDAFFADWELEPRDYRIIKNAESSLDIRDGVTDSGLYMPSRVPLMSGVSGWTRYAFRRAARRCHRRLLAEARNSRNTWLREHAGANGKSSAVGMLLRKRSVANRP